MSVLDMLPFLGVAPPLSFSLLLPLSIDRSAGGPTHCHSQDKLKNAETRMRRVLEESKASKVLVC